MTLGAVLRWRSDLTLERPTRCSRNDAKRAKRTQRNNSLLAYALFDQRVGALHQVAVNFRERKAQVRVASAQGCLPLQLPPHDLVVSGSERDFTTGTLGVATDAQASVEGFQRDCVRHLTNTRPLSTHANGACQDNRTIPTASAARAYRMYAADQSAGGSSNSLPISSRFQAGRNLLSETKMKGCWAPCSR